MITAFVIFLFFQCETRKENEASLFYVAIACTSYVTALLYDIAILSLLIKLGAK
jgi:hypothetical protein